MTADVLCLCEGFDDRDFLAGWFEHVRGWRDARKGGIVPPLFGGGQELKGIYCFDAPKSDRRIGIVPAFSRKSLGKELSSRLEAQRKLGTSGHVAIVVCADVDQPFSSKTDGVTDLVRQAVKAAGCAVPKGPAPWTVEKLPIEVVSMRAGKQAASHLDPKERLERVVTAAFASAYASRYDAMCEWLQQRPDPSDLHGEAAHWTIMAAWFPKGGCSDFLRRAIWHDPAMSERLQEILAQTGLPETTKRLETTTTITNG